MSWYLIREVAWREIRTRARTKAFRAVTILFVVAAVAGPIVAAAWPDGDDDDLRTVTIGVVDMDPELRAEISALAAGALEIDFRDLGSPDQVAPAIHDGEIDLAVEPGPTLVWDQVADVEVAAVVGAALRQRDALGKARDLGLDDREVAALLAQPQVQERFVDPLDESDEVAQTLAFLGLMLVFALPQAFGQLALLSVVEEKSTRVVEVLLNHLQPRALLLGKVLGLTALAVAQLAVVLAGLTAALLATDTIDIPASAWRFLPVVAASVLGGLVVYTTLFALLGSLVSRQEDASQVTLPAMVPAMVGFFAAQAAVAGNAASTLAQALTLFPLTAPFMLPVRVARDAIAPWEVAAAFCLLGLGARLLVRTAGRVYQFTLLHMGARVDWSRLLRLARRGAQLEATASRG